MIFGGATIWTCAGNQVFTNGHFWIFDGKIRKVGRGITSDTGQPLENVAGLHITPGLIDAHSHTAIVGAVNESTLPSTAMVRIGDVVNSETKNLYEQLGGGLTTANLLHGDRKS